MGVYARECVCMCVYEFQNECDQYRWMHGYSRFAEHLQSINNSTSIQNFDIGDNFHWNNALTTTLQFGEEKKIWKNTSEKRKKTTNDKKKEEFFYTLEVLEFHKCVSTNGGFVKLWDRKKNSSLESNCKWYYLNENLQKKVNRMWLFYWNVFSCTFITKFFVLLVIHTDNKSLNSSGFKQKKKLGLEIKCVVMDLLFIIINWYKMIQFFLRSIRRDESDTSDQCRLLFNFFFFWCVIWVSVMYKIIENSEILCNFLDVFYLFEIIWSYFGTQNLINYYKKTENTIFMFILKCWSIRSWMK